MKNKIQELLLVVVGLFAFQSVIAQEFDDATLKKYVKPVNNATSQVMQLKPQLYEYKAEYNRSLKLPSGRQFGFSIDNMETVFPQLVKSRTISYSTGKNLFKQAYVKEVEMEGLIPVLVESIRELQTQITQLKAEIQALKK